MWIKSLSNVKLTILREMTRPKSATRDLWPRSTWPNSTTCSQTETLSALITFSLQVTAIITRNATINSYNWPHPRLLRKSLVTSSFHFVFHLVKFSTIFNQFKYILQAAAIPTAFQLFFCSDEISSKCSRLRSHHIYESHSKTTNNHPLIRHRHQN